MPDSAVASRDRSAASARPGASPDAGATVDWVGAPDCDGADGPSCASMATGRLLAAARTGGAGDRRPVARGRPVRRAVAGCAARPARASARPDGEAARSARPPHSSRQAGRAGEQRHRRPRRRAPLRVGAVAGADEVERDAQARREPAALGAPAVTEAAIRVDEHVPPVRQPARRHERAGRRPGAVGHTLGGQLQHRQHLDREPSERPAQHRAARRRRGRCRARPRTRPGASRRTP